VGVAVEPSRDHGRSYHEREHPFPHPLAPLNAERTRVPFGLSSPQDGFGRPPRARKRTSVALKEVGPITLTVCEQPRLTWTSKELQKGRRFATIQGVATVVEAEQLRELLTNPDIRQAIGQAFGVLDTMWFDDSVLGHLSGSYLLQSFQETDTAQPEGSRKSHVGFTLQVLYLGPDPELVTFYTPRQLSNAYALKPQSIIWDSTYSGTERTAGMDLSDPSIVVRDYDAQTESSGPSMSRYMRGFLAPDYELSIDPSRTLAPGERATTAESLEMVGKAPGRVVVRLWCPEARNRGNSRSTAVATIVKTPRYGLVFKATLDGTRALKPENRRVLIAAARGRRHGKRSESPFNEVVIVLLEQPILLEDDEQPVYGGVPRVQCSHGVSKLDAAELRDIALRVADRRPPASFLIPHPASIRGSSAGRAR